MTARGALYTSRYIREIHTHAQEKSLSGLVRKHALKRQAQTVLYVPDRPAAKQHRTVWCGRHTFTEGGMPIFRRLDGKNARVGKLKTCGSVWACPVCSAKVAEQRRAELTFAMAKHTDPYRFGPIAATNQAEIDAHRGHAYLLTFTFPHYIGQLLDELMPLFEKARQRFQNSRAWKAVMDTQTGTAGRVGSVNSLEVTYGSSNGWHPHLHMLVFCNGGAFGESGHADADGRLSSKAIEFFRGEWVRHLEAVGLVDSSNRTWANAYALDVRGGTQAAEYISKWGHDGKWGLSSELTKSHAKIGTRDTWGAADHYTPFELLAMSEVGDGHATCAFREFVEAFDGKRMLTWSRDLKNFFGVAEMDDQDAAAEQELALTDEHCVGELAAEQLQVLTKWGQFGYFLAFVAEHCRDPDSQGLIDDWIANCGGGRVRSGTIRMDRLVTTDYAYFSKAEVLEM